MGIAVVDALGREIDRAWGACEFDPAAFAQLSAEQAARLAAMAPAPRRFERNPDSAYLAGRVATILARMPAAIVP